MDGFTDFPRREVRTFFFSFFFFGILIEKEKKIIIGDMVLMVDDLEK